MNRKHVATPYLFWILGFTIIPLLMICKFAFTNDAGQLTLENILAIFDPVHGKALLVSLKIAFVCTVICLCLAFPLTLALRALHFGKKSFIIMVLILPMWMNFILRVMAWQMILSQNGLLNLLLTSIGLPPIAIINTQTAIMVGMVYDFLPYMILPIYNALNEIDERIIEAAKDLGANNLTVVRKIILPLTVPGIVSGIVMVFVPSMTSFVIANILGGGKIQLIGNVIEQEFTTSLDWNLGSGISLALMIFVLISMVFLFKNDGEEKGTMVW